MVTRSMEVVDGLNQRSIPGNRSRGRLPPLLLLLVRISLGVSLGLTLLVLTVVFISRLSAIPQVTDLPQSYLPGSRLPQELSCYTPVDEHKPRCSAPLGQTEVYFDFDPDTQQIVRSIIPAYAYSMRQLYAAWGRPSAIRWHEFTIYVYWNTRSAEFYVSTLRPQSRASFILYELQAPDDVSPWNGFRPPQT